jgi:4-amino-4-deoxy-L-arabinose transferase-like glycosyltransferase
VTVRRAYALVAAACVLPRLAVLVHERNDVLTAFVEKSDLLARTFVASGTFGFIPGEPSASTQPLYGWFLIPIYWLPGRHWWSVGLAQILVALVTSVLVLEIGRRFLSLRAGVVAAVAATLQPYLVWHDVHVNREILDQALGAAMFLLTLLVARRRSLPLALALGAVTGLAVLSNSRLALLPLALAAYLLWSRAGWAAAVAVPVLAVVVTAPWLVRNEVQVGCLTLTTDARALWKANNADTYETLAGGKWIDDVPDIPERSGGSIPERWLTPQEAGGIYRSTGRRIHVDECAQQAHYQHLVFEFWKQHPGAKLKLAVQATGMEWDPRVDRREGRSEQGGPVDALRQWVEPLYVVPLYLLALAGLFAVAPAFRALALLFLLYETAAAWVFAGTTRYRVPWDFVLALLAAAAIDNWPFRRGSSSRPFARSPSQKR